MSGPPRMSMHIGDYLKDTPPIGRVNWEHHGIYWCALMITWNTPRCQLPVDPEWLAVRFGCTLDEYHQHVEPVLKTYFKSDGNFYRQKRQRKEFDFSVKQSRAQSERAKALHRKRKQASRGTAPAEPESQSGSAPPAPALEEERKKDPVAIATEQLAPLEGDPPDIKSAVWQAGLAYLGSVLRKPDAQVRRLLGRWCGEYGDELVWMALGTAQREKPVEVVSWIEGWLKHRRPPPRADSDYSPTKMIREMMERNGNGRAAGDSGHGVLGENVVGLPPPAARRGE